MYSILLKLTYHEKAIQFGLRASNFFDHYYYLSLTSDGILWHVSLYCPNASGNEFTKKAPAPNQQVPARSSSRCNQLSIPVEYKQIPPNFIHAFLAAEDSSFFEHSGISFKGLGRALSESVTGSDVQTGGSTITMQVAKNYYLSPERTLKRKLTEIFLARKIEQNLSKEDILSLYVNKIFLGKNAYGIAAAAKIYYNKSINELSIAQMAMIAGLPKAPSKYNPVVNPERALERRNWILGRMLQLGYISQAEYQKAVAEPINLNMPNRDLNNIHPYAGEMVRSELVKHFGEQAIDSGYKVYTTIAPRLCGRS
ncbi:hypothetical protein KHAB170019_35480 [Acinetobacter baumannii]|nr:hypothetical protein KHAB170019_35480 [Acinetobacter baumannii]